MEEIIKVDDITPAIREYDVRELKEGQMNVYCSVKAETREQQNLVFNAANSPEEKVADHINEVIPVKDVYVEVLDLVDEETGVIEKAPRIVLIDPEGKGYECVSTGIYSALRKMIPNYGEPSWEPPLNLQIKQQKTKNGSMLTVRAV